jgi:4-nitrophenyl phosphatase
LKTYKGFLLDLDGTVYRGGEAIPEAVSFVRELKKAGIPFLYLTNNSSASPEHVAARLRAMGVQAEAEEVYTSAMATAAYLAQREPAGADVYVIGEEGLKRALELAGFRLVEENPRYVAVGIDRQFTYEKLKAAARAIRGGALFLATNQDAALPTEEGLLPGNGSLVAAVSVASGVSPIVIGKPEKIIVDLALQRLGTAAAETLIVGDNLFTDIEAGANSGLDSLLVLTGFSTAEDAARHPYKPTYIAADLLSWWRRQQR